MIWQQKALREESGDAAAECWLQAAHLYSIAAYPFINGDFLADQAVTLKKAWIKGPKATTPLINFG